MYADEFQKILMETSPEEKAIILREVLEESGIPYVLNQGGFVFPNLFSDTFETEKKLVLAPMRTSSSSFTSAKEDRHSQQFSLQLSDLVTGYVSNYGVQMDFNVA